MPFPIEVPEPFGADLTFADFQTTIQAMVKAATGFDNGHVIWANQTRKRPARPFIELYAVQEDVSFFSEDTEFDTAGQPSGQEVTLQNKEHIEITVQIRVFTSAVTGIHGAVAIANRIRAYTNRESVNDILDEIALIERGSVRDASLVLETEYEGRAVLDLKFRVADLETETTTFIEHATVQTTIAQTNGDVTITDTIPE